MRAALCDDNEDFLLNLEEQIKGLPLDCETRCFSGLAGLWASLEAGEVYDVVLMDIDLSDRKTGLDAAEELYRLAPETKIIYVTGYTEEYIQQVFLRSANLSGYLVKPVDGELLLANLRKVADGLQQQSEVLLLRVNGLLTSIPVAGICYVESQAHTVVLHTAQGSLTIYEKLGGMLQKLPESFCQCHKSYLVNMCQIQRIQYGSVLLKNGAEVPVSRSRYTQLRENYFRFVGRAI